MGTTIQLKIKKSENAVSLTLKRCSKDLRIVNAVGVQMYNYLSKVFK